MRGCRSLKRVLRVLLCGAWLAPVAAAWALDPPKFGKVSDEELHMTAPPEAADADAVILLDKCEARVILENSVFRLEAARQIRIKVLTQEGKSQGDRVITFWDNELITDLDAYSVLPDGTRAKLKSSEVFEEKESGLHRMKFAIPGVDVGAVIEYRYKLRSRHVNSLDRWFFQNDQFTKTSQFSALVYPGFNYNVQTKNMDFFEPEIERVILPNKETAKLLTWTCRDVPALRAEPYMRSLDDYRDALFFDMLTYQDGGSYREFSTSWANLVHQYREEDQRQRLPTKVLERLAAERTKNCATPRARLDTLFAHVSRQIATTGRGWPQWGKAAAEVVEEATGSGVEKNMLLVDLLSLAGLEAYPLLISTRDNGMVLQERPSLRQFDDLLAYVKIGPDAFFLDTGSSNCPLGMLPEDMLVEQGLLIDKKDGQFIHIPQPSGINMLYCGTTAGVDAEGHLSATSLLRFEGQHGIEVRDRLAAQPAEDYVKALLKGCFGEALLDTFIFEELDKPDLPLRLTLRYRLPGYAQVAGDMLYLGIPSLNMLKDNPFTNKSRQFPVEFPYRVTYTDEVELSIPEGYELVDAPQPVSLQQGALKFISSSEMVEGTVRQQRQMLRNTLLVSSVDYAALRDFHDKVVAADQGRLVLQRKAGRP